MATGSTWQRPDLVPLAERLRFLQLFRVAVVALALAIAFTGDPPGSLRAIMSLGAGVLVGGLVARLFVGSVSVGRWLFGIVLLGDGLVLAVLVHLLGGLASPGRYLVVVHVLVVTLIASYRTGLKLAIWHSLLVLLVHEAGEIEWLRTPTVDDPTRALVVYVGLVWTVALLTASASAVNEREILRRRYDLDAFARMSGALELATGLHDVARTVVDHICDTFNAPRGGIVSLRDDDPIMLAGRRLSRVDRAGTIAGLLGAVADRGETLLVTGLGDGDEWLAGHLPDARHLMLVPLAVDGTADEILIIEHAPHGNGVKRTTVTTVERFAAHGALALRNARLHGELVAMAKTDGLTGVANRAAFDQTLASELDRLERTGGSVGLILCDLDHFKQVNDRYGHQVGDELLTAVAQALRDTSRSYDTVARYGGEEFAIILPHLTDQTAHAIAERFRAAVAAITAPAAVTASVGVPVTTPPPTAAAMIPAAARALYQAKQHGRDRVRIANHEPAPDRSDTDLAAASRPPAPRDARA